MIQEISSPSNNKIKFVKRIATSRKDRKQNNLFIVEGYRSVATILGNKSGNYTVEEIYISQAESDSDRAQVYMADLQTIPVFVVKDSIFHTISEVVHSQGIIALVRYKDIDPAIKDTGFYLLVDSVGDPGNLGTLIRSAVGAGFHGVLLYSNTVDVYNPKTIRSTMGNFAFIDIYCIDQVFLQNLREKKYDIIITKMSANESVFTAEFSQRTVLAVGSEAHGVSDEIKSLATRSIYIPMNPKCESLNVAVAGSICMFQIAKQFSLFD